MTVETETARVQSLGRMDLEAWLAARGKAIKDFPTSAKARQWIADRVAQEQDDDGA